MSRIRGIEVKIQHNVLQARRNGIVDVKKKPEDKSTNAKEDEEKDQIKELLYKLPKLDKIFEVHRKIGEGTFSSVYLGSLKQHSGLPNSDKRWFAIKHLVPTAHPARVEHELRCLQDMGGKNNVIGVELCLRHYDTIVFVMPYIPHKKFWEYVGEMDAAELRRYMRALLSALRHVHSFNVIHRDVKPSNFLYDRVNQRYLLVDFGLAQRLSPPPEEPPALTATGKRPRDRDEGPAPPAKRAAVGDSCRCRCRGAAGVCGACCGLAAARAPRAGTQGFRPPEVLLKYPHQTTAVDMWAAGVILASVLTARYPLFRAADDVSALGEVADLLGTEPLAGAAGALGRRLVMSTSRRGVCLRKLSVHLRASRGAPTTTPTPTPTPATAPNLTECTRCHMPSDTCLCLDTDIPAERCAAGAVWAGFPDSAFSLAAQLLQPLPAARLTAAAALRHAFFADG